MAFWKSKNRSTHPRHQARELWKAHKKGWVFVIALLLMATTAVQENAQYLQLSLLTAPEHAPFDGTVFPVQQVPDWLEASADEQDMIFADFPAEKLMDIPNYDPDRLPLDSSTLEWGDPYDDYTRQMIITYPVVYAGTYNLDGVEGLGSHPAVDIKALKGTPVYAVMNGVVDKVQYSGYGYGNLVVLRHNDVPTPNGQGDTTLYSGYAHLDDILIGEGDVVTKGQMIGTVGDTGTATTDHLHFQMDNSDAPWHLYWPFTSAESTPVGGFFSAVNVGLGRENVYAYTEHPIEYVQDHVDAGAVIEDPVVAVEVTDVPDPVDLNDVEEEVVAEEIPAEDDGPVFVDITFDHETFMATNTTQYVKVSLVDERGEVVMAPYFNTPIQVSVSDSEVIQTARMELGRERFAPGFTEMAVTALAPGTATISLTAFGETYPLGEIVVTSELKPLDAFALEVDEDFYIGEPVIVAIVGLNEDSERIPTFELNEPVQFEVVQGEGYFSRAALTEADFEEGVAAVQFTPVTDDNIILRAYAGEIDGASNLLTSALFTDLDSSHPYYQSIRYLKSKGVIEGYDDHTFRAENAVSRVEILKMLYEAFVKEVVSGNSLSFPDTDPTAWYAPYVATAERDGLVQGDSNTGLFRPADAVNRVEAIKVLGLALGVDIDPVVIGNPFEDVHYLDWYAPYAQFGSQTNILPWAEDSLYPGEAMTRGEVAEMIYRVLAIQQNSAESYSRMLVVE